MDVTGQGDEREKRLLQDWFDTTRFDKQRDLGEVPPLDPEPEDPDDDVKVSGMDVPISSEAMKTIERLVEALKDPLAGQRKTVPTWMPDGEPIETVEQLATAMRCDTKSAALAAMEAKDARCDNISDSLVQDAAATLNFALGIRDIGKELDQTYAELRMTRAELSAVVKPSGDQQNTLTRVADAATQYAQDMYGAGKDVYGGQSGPGSVPPRGHGRVLRRRPKNRRRMRGVLYMKDDQPDYSDGIMVAFKVPEPVARQIAVDGGLPWEDMHVTVAYLGKTGDLTAETQADFVTKVLDCVKRAAEEHSPVEGTLNATARFQEVDTGKDCVVLLLDSNNIDAFQQVLLEYLEAEELPVSTEHGFIPHVTLAYVATGAEAPRASREKVSVVFDTVYLVYGEAEIPIKMGSDNADRPLIDEPGMRPNS